MLVDTGRGKRCQALMFIRIYRVPSTALYPAKPKGEKSKTNSIKEDYAKLLPQGKVL